MLIAFHGTKYDSAKTICINGFDKDHYPKWTSDLGKGVYGFIDGKDCGLESPKYLATQYAGHKYKNVRIGTLKLNLNITDAKKNICNLNDPTIRNNFIKTRNNFARLIHSEYGNIVSSNASKRDNEDGILIEKLIQRKIWNNWQAVICDTYTRLPEFAKESNFPNSREICIRDLNIIKAVSLC